MQLQCDCPAAALPARCIRESCLSRGVLDMEPLLRPGMPVPPARPVLPPRLLRFPTEGPKVMVLLDSYYAPGHRTKFPEEAALAVPLAAAAIGSSLREHVAEALALPLTCVRLTKGGIRVADDSALAEGDVVRLLPMLPASCAFAGRRVVRPLVERFDIEP